MSVGFHVNHVPQLLGRYGRRLDVSVARTDQAPPPDAPPALPEELRLSAERNAWEDVLLSALEDQVCTDAPAPEGVDHHYRTDLAPNARYDLLVTAPTAADDEDDEDIERILIARAPFRTSRYANPAAQLAACGFVERDALGPGRPHDFILSADAMRASIRPADRDDLAFEEALNALGVDFDAADKPRTTVLWARSAAASAPEIDVPKPTPYPDLRPPTRRPTLPRLRERTRGASRLRDLLNPNVVDRIVNPNVIDRETIIKEILRERGDVLRDALGEQPTPEPVWAVGGVLIESDEPILRQTVSNVALRVAPLRSPLPLVRSDAAGARLLFLAEAPQALMLPDHALSFSYRYERREIVSGALQSRFSTSVAELFIGSKPLSVDWGG